MTAPTAPAPDPGCPYCVAEAAGTTVAADDPGRPCPAHRALLDALLDGWLAALRDEVAATRAAA